jgi:hypothetical protein
MRISIVRLKKTFFEERKAALLIERKDLQQQLTQAKQHQHSLPDRLREFLELARSALLLHEMALPEEKRDLLKIVTSNRLVNAKNVVGSEMDKRRKAA